MKHRALSHTYFHALRRMRGILKNLKCLTSELNMVSAMLTIKYFFNIMDKKSHKNVVILKIKDISLLIEKACL